MSDETPNPQATPDAPTSSDPAPTIVDVPPNGEAPAAPSPAPADAGHEWLPEKFKTPEALVQSYTELEKKLTSMTRAPEAYELKIPDDVEVDQKILDTFKTAQLTNEQAQSVLDMYTQDILPSFVTVSKELELQKLSNQLGLSVEKGTEEAQRVLTWAQTQVNGDEMVKEFGTSAAGTLYLREKMLASVQSERVTDVPGHPNVQTQSRIVTPAEIDQMIQDPRYATDPAYRSMVRGRIEQSMQAETEQAAASI